MSVLSEGQIRSLRDMATRGMSVTEIMAKTGIAYRTIRKYCADVLAQKKTSTAIGELNKSSDVLIYQIQDDARNGLNFAQIAQKRGIHIVTAMRYGRDQRDEYLAGRNQHITRMAHQGMSFSKIAQHFGIAIKTVGEIVDSDKVADNLRNQGLLIGANEAADYMGISLQQFQGLTIHRVIVERQMFKGQCCYHIDDLDSLVDAGYADEDLQYTHKREKLFKLREQQCPNCERAFVGNPQRVYCSDECRTAHRNRQQYLRRKEN